MGAKAGHSTTPTEIRRMAVVMTVFVWVMGFGMMTLYHRQPLARAAAIAAFNALGGLLAWVIYHTISQRIDGMLIFLTACMGMVPATDQKILSMNEELARRAVVLVVMASMSVVFGLFVRRSRKGSEQTENAPLWDAEVDRPPPVG